MPTTTARSGQDRPSEEYHAHTDRNHVKDSGDAASFTELLEAGSPTIKKSPDVAKMTIPGKIRLVQVDGRELAEQAIRLKDGTVAWISMEERLEEKGMDIAAKAENALREQKETTGKKNRPHTVIQRTTAAIVSKSDSLAAFLKRHKKHLEKGLDIEVDTEQFAKDAVIGHLKTHGYLVRVLGGEPDTLLGACENFKTRFVMATAKERDLIVYMLNQAGGNWLKLIPHIHVKGEPDSGKVIHDVQAKVKAIE